MTSGASQGRGGLKIPPSAEGSAGVARGIDPSDWKFWPDSSVFYLEDRL